MVLELPHLLGVTLALLAATSFAVQFLFIRLGTIRGRIIQGVFITLLVNMAIVIPAVLWRYGIPSLTLEAIIWFALAGLFGSLIARTCTFKSVQLIGASRTSPIIAANVFFATILAIVLFGESVTLVHLFGIVIIVIGVAIISWEMANDGEVDQSIREIGLSLLLPLGAAFFIGLEPILVSAGLNTGAGVLPGVAIKVTAACIGILAYSLVTGHTQVLAFERTSQTGWFLATGVTSAIGIIAYFAALEVSPVVIVVPLIQTSPLMVFVLSWVFIPHHLERLSWRLFAAALVVVAGAAIVSVQ